MGLRKIKDKKHVCFRKLLKLPKSCNDKGNVEYFPISLTGHLSSLPVANIFGVTSRGLTFSPPCLIFVGPLAKVRYSIPLSSRYSQNFQLSCWCSCRPLKPKCCVSNHHIVLISAQGFPLPSWPLFQSVSLLLHLLSFWVHSDVFLSLLLLAFVLSPPGL